MIKQEITKLVKFSEEEWQFIQNYKHANRLKNDMKAIKGIIDQAMQRNDRMLIKSLERNHAILKELADK